MTGTDTDTKPDRIARPVRPPKPPKYKIRQHTPDDYTGNNSKVLQEFDTERQARNWIKQHAPRGRHVYLQLPNGDREHYSADLEMQGDDPWIEYHEDEDA